MATVQRRRAQTQTASKTKSSNPIRKQTSDRNKTNSVEHLANAMATKLTISDGINSKKGKQKALEPKLSDEEKRVVSMRAVNAASQMLSTTVQSGPRKGSEVISKSGTTSGVIDAAESALMHLRFLRSLSPNDLNVEKAAISILGKFVTLEMDDAAFSALKDMQPQLCAHLNVPPSNHSQELVSCLHIPILPYTSGEVDTTLLTIVSTYLAYALTGKAKDDSFIHALADILEENHHICGSTLLPWVPFFASLPSKHVDALLTRVYTSLTKFCTFHLSMTTATTQGPSSKKHVSLDETLHAAQRSAYRIRIYALQCLTHTKDGVVAPAAIWEQAVRFGSAYVKALTHQRPARNDILEVEVTQTILKGCSKLVDRVESMPDSDRERLMKEKAFISFLEWWMTFARRASDLQTLNRISLLMRPALASSASCSNVSGPSTGGEAIKVVQGAEIPSKDKSSKTTEALLARSAHICTVFAQITTLIELFDESKEGEELIVRTRETIPLLSTSKSLQELMIANYSPSVSDDASVEAVQRAGDKCDRSLEKLRKAALKTFGSISISDYSLQDARTTLLQLLEEIVNLFDRISLAHPVNGLYTRALDTLFNLARTTLVVHDPRSHVLAYKYIDKAIKLLRFNQEGSNIITGLSRKDLANYVRCISGTLYNLAGSLYQDGKYGAAIGFLVDGCKLGRKALSMHPSIPQKVKNSDSDTSRDDNEAIAVDQREADGWRQLEEQLYRRWELLGVCYSKIGDRKNAYSAFIDCVKAFPYTTSGFVDKACRLSVTILFEATPALKQLASIVDRVSYMSACELFLDPLDVSLSRDPVWVDAERPDSIVIGALLERQIYGLETSRWKPNVKSVVAQLIAEADRVYQADVNPVRKARVLLRWLEFMYHGGLSQEGLEAKGFQRFGIVTEVAKEVEQLLSREDLADDAELAPFRSQYRASAHLWCALHAHCKAGTHQNTLVAQHAEDASSILKILLSDVARSEPRKSSSKVSIPSPPKRTPPKKAGTVGRKVAAGAGGYRTRVTRKVVVREPVTPKPKARSVLRPIPLNSATPPKAAVPYANAGGLILDDFDKFLRLLQTAGHILGLMALILPKVHVLDVTRKICERYVGVTSDGYISASIDLAHEYVKLGKLRRASAVFNHASTSVRSGQVSNDICSLFLLRYAEALAVLEDVPQSSVVYCEALVSSQRCIIEEKSMPTLQKIQLRVKRLERAAMAAHVFALIQYLRNDTVIALDGMLQSLRLWNRAVDTLARLNQISSSKGPEEKKDIFDVTSLKEALPGEEPTQQDQQEKRLHKPSLDTLEWRVSEGLLSTLFSLCQAYFFRGSAKEAEYFAQQAHDLSLSMNAPALLSRALAKKGEILLQLGKLEEAHECLSNASDILANIPGIDSADVYRLYGDHNQRAAKDEDAHQMYLETTTMLEELDTAFKHFDGLALGPRKSAGLTPVDKPAKEIIVPDLLAAVLRRQIWLLRDEGGDEYMELLEKFMALPYSSRTKAEENALMAQLTLHNVYSRFRNDMFLSSLTESAIALPMGMTSKRGHAISPTTHDLLNILDNAAKLFWANLSLIAASGSVPDVRNATISLALISAFQTSLGRPSKYGSSIATGLLDASSAVTLHREMLEAVHHKFLDLRFLDDLEWPLITPEGKPLPRPTKKPDRSIFGTSDGENDDDWNEKEANSYWDYIRQKYQSQVYDPKSISSCLEGELPPNWTAVHISVASDKSTLFISRQRGLNGESSPLIFCVPLKDRRDNGAGDEDETHLTLDGALGELREIVSLSDLGTRAAAHIDARDELARTNWWKERRDLDRRLKELLNNIEFCWLGAFKTILNPSPKHPMELLIELRLKLEKFFQQSLGVLGKHIKSRSQRDSDSAPLVSPSELTLDDALVECFSTLSPKCRDEELEDMIYFILDLYQFHGIRVAVAEIDMVQLVVDLRTTLEEHAGRVRKSNQPTGPKATKRTVHADDNDEHIFLVLGKDLQGIPWESIPTLRGRSVSRVPNLNFLLDRIEFVKRQHSAPSSPCIDSPHKYSASVDPRKGYYILNPSGDLGRTQERFVNWARDMEKVGWHGTIGRPPSEQQFLDALERQDLVVYFGHGGGEQYVRTHKVRHLRRCAATMLWGCSSGALREMGDFDRTGTPNSYFIAGCPTLVANLWDVTDKDIDKFSQSVFDKLNLSANSLKDKPTEESSSVTSVVTAVAQSREVCKLKYLTGAAPVVYGIPFYL
ncbi:hypothetical protein AX15_006159 [Amanita polypyramis BW_CC]|nr:hypothetical protein AX15_006159 [Amanita polypyramis BW_CC]